MEGATMAVAADAQRAPLLHPLAGSRPEALARILWRHGGVSGRRLGTLAVVTASCLLRWPSCIVESLRIRDRVRRVRFDPPPVFIVGFWRSGTTFLHNVMSRDPRFAYPTFIEAVSPYDCVPAPWSPWVRRLVLRAVPAKRPMDDVPVRADLPVEEDVALAAMDAPSFMNCLYFPRDLSGTFMREVMFTGSDTAAMRRWSRTLHEYLAKISAMHPGKRLILKSPANSARVARLMEQFPGAKFVHIHRNPSEVFTSARRLYARMLPLVALQNYDASKIDAHIIRSYELVMDRLREEFPRVPRGQACTVRYDDLVARPLETVKNIYDQLDLGDFEGARPLMESFLASMPVRPAPPAPVEAAVERELCQRWQRHFDWLGYPAPRLTPAGFPHQ